MKKVGILLTIAILIGLAACTPGVIDGMVVASGSILQSDKVRLAAPEVPSADQNTFTDGNSAFAFDLYQQLKGEDGNFFYSPYSISAALAMTFAGANGITAEQMADVMHYDLPQERLHPAFNWLERELNSRGEGGDAEAFRLSVANAIWGQKDYKFRLAFLDTLAENYGTGLRIVNFGDTEKSRLTINDWVSQQTEGRIEELVEPDSLTSDTRLVLTNAIYFKAAWLHKFMLSDTKDGPFYLLDGGNVTVPMMHQTMLFGYMEGDGYRAAELPYKGEEFSMVILLPDEGNFIAFEDALDSQTLAAIISQFEIRNTQVAMPKFQFESEFDLKDVLSALGMADAFDADNANFSGMTDIEDLWIDNVTHKAFVSVDENGTEASAATAATMVASLPGKVTMDRPFIFVIRDMETDSILFMGRVLNPVA
ncbi:MAG: serpin family protein [Dehalococcoidales bacterium]|nr:serpin family protein [Dehalococcoidales bacterium]